MNTVKVRKPKSKETGYANNYSSLTDSALGYQKLLGRLLAVINMKQNSFQLEACNQLNLHTDLGHF